MKYGNLVERDHGPPAEGAARFHTTRRTIVMREAQGGHFALAEIDEEIHALCDALIASEGRLGHENRGQTHLPELR